MRIGSTRTPFCDDRKEKADGKEQKEEIPFSASFSVSTMHFVWSRVEMDGDNLSISSRDDLIERQVLAVIARRQVH